MYSLNFSQNDEYAGKRETERCRGDLARAKGQAEQVATITAELQEVFREVQFLDNQILTKLLETMSFSSFLQHQGGFFLLDG